MYIMVPVQSFRVALDHSLSTHMYRTRNFLKCVRVSPSSCFDVLQYLSGVWNGAIRQESFHILVAETKTYAVTASKTPDRTHL